MDKLNEKELRVLNQVAQNSVISQRELARETGISLGLINVILNKFLKTGYLQVASLNKRKLEYLLTPQGFLTITRRTYQFATRTIQNYRNLQRQLAELLLRLNQDGFNYFSVHGDGELKEMIEVVVAATFSEGAARLGDEHRADSQAVVLNITAEPMSGNFDGKIISVLESLGR